MARDRKRGVFVVETRGTKAGTWLLLLLWTIRKIISGIGQMVGELANLSLLD